MGNSLPPSPPGKSNRVAVRHCQWLSLTLPPAAFNSNAVAANVDNNNNDDLSFNASSPPPVVVPPPPLPPTASSAAVFATACPRSATMATAAARLHPPPHQVGNAPVIHAASAGKDLIRHHQWSPGPPCGRQEERLVQLAAQLPLLPCVRGLNNPSSLA
jgi:hypothetical protein